MPPPSNAETSQDNSSSETDTYSATVETKSLTDSIREHIIEGGLRYHAYCAGKYPFPNDDVEQQCDEMRHYLTVALCDGREFFAPIEEMLEKGAEVLDLGTGTGTWCTELADMFTNSSFTGIDLSPIQPELVPPKVEFLVDDIEHEDGWDYPDNHFDYIHIRHTLHTIKDPKTLIERAFKHLKPGGYFEIQEFHYEPHCDDATLTPETTYRLRDFYANLATGLAALGSDLHAITRAEAHLATAGFTSVTSHTLKCPVGNWPDAVRLAEYGNLLSSVILDGLKGVARRPLVVGLQWTPVQVEMLLVEVRKAVADTDIHAYLPFHAIHARKPVE